MYKLAKWSYERGVQHERMRIKKLTAEYQRESNHRIDVFKSDRNQKPSKQQLELDDAVNAVFHCLLEPQPINAEYRVAPAPIDE